MTCVSARAKVKLRKRGGTPNKKTDISVINAKGLIAIAKNIEVVDEFGKKYEATYPKRARGLVKHGRARYITPTKIELIRPKRAAPQPQHPPETGSTMEEKASPPLIFNLEDNIMSENTINPSEILSRIDTILADSAHITRALDYAKDINMSGAVQEHPITAIVMSRETTNQRMIDLLEKMYDDAKPQRTRRPFFTAAAPTEPVDGGDVDDGEPHDSTFFGININREKVDEFRRDAEKFVREWAGTARDAGRTAAEATKEAVKAAAATVRNSRAADDCEACNCTDCETEVVDENDTTEE